MRKFLFLCLCVFSSLTFAGVEIPAGAKSINICTDYNSSLTCRGEPYTLNTPRGVITKHEGVDFEAPAGTQVISASHGQVVLAGQTECGGGYVVVKTEFLEKDETTSKMTPVYIRYVHVTPNNFLGKVRSLPTDKGNFSEVFIKPGDEIGKIQNVNDIKFCVGMRHHLHFETVLKYSPEKVHVNPHKYWMNGENKLTCFREGMEVPKNKIIAPIKCGE